jgi:hypothetical protein
MASATSVPLIPNQIFNLPQAGANRVTRTLRLAQVGLFSVHTTGFVTRSDDLGAGDGGPAPGPAGGSGPGGGPGGGGPGGGGGSGSHRTNVDLDWSLTSPDGKTTLKPRSVLQAVVISADLLARNRDPAGFSTGTWTLVLALPPKVDSITQIECSAMIGDLPAASESPPPILDVQQVLRDNETHTFDFSVDRIGDLTVTVNSTPSVQIVVELVDFANRTVATGTNSVTHPIALQDLHATRGGLWHLKLTAPPKIPPGGSANCVVFVRVIDTLRIPASVLQPRFDAILGNPNGSFRIVIDRNPVTQTNVVYIISSEDFYFTLDAFGYLDNLENARLALDKRSDPNAARVNLDPNVAYPFTTFESDIKFHNLMTGAMTLVAGTPGIPNGGIPVFTLTVPLVPNPGGKPTELDVPVVNEAGVTVEVTVAITQATIIIDFFHRGGRGCRALDRRQRA